MSLECKYAGTCSGCDWAKVPYSEQRTRKIQSLREWTGIQDVEFISVGESGLRDRADLVLKWTGGTFHLGLWSLGGFDSRELVDLDDCPMMSSELRPWFLEFRKSLKLLPASLGEVIRVGSVRIRVGLRGERGLWLDFSNVSVKALLEERTWLESLLSMGVVVEIGQRRKVLVRKGDRLGLDEGLPREWFASWDMLERAPIPLSLSVGGFSQPSVRANRALVEWVARAVLEVARLNSGESARRTTCVMELGAGNGNLTFAMARLPGVRVVAVENDGGALDAMVGRTLQGESTIEVLRANFFRPNEELLNRARQSQVWVCDPSRGGLKSAIDWMGAILEERSHGEHRVRLVYVSCDPKALAGDMKALALRGAKFSRAVIVDQFPQSHHFECVVW